MRATERTSAQLVVLSIVLLAAVFFVDIALPLGVAGGVPYVAVVLVSFWSPQRRYFLVLATIASVLTVLGFFLSPPAGILWIVLVNRFLALFAIWVTALLGLQRKGAEEALRKVYGGLETQVAERTAELEAANKQLEVELAERQRAEEALRQSEAEYRSLIQGAAYGIYRSTAEGKFLDVNPALVAMLGYDSESELLAANLATEIYRDPSERARLVEQYKHQERFDGLQVEWKSKDDTPINVRLSGRAVQDKDGTLAYFEGIAENVTEQRLLEAQLRQGQKMEAVGRLAGGVAHDFNNLLMVMRGYTELLLGRLGANDPLRRNVEEIQEAADRAASLTRQLLAFSRKQVMQPRVFDLNAVVSDTEKMLRRLIGEDIELATLLGAELGRAKADPGQIEQVILNLAVNARDAMPQGGKLVLETTNVELTQAFARQHPGVTPGPHVMLAMSDTGVGMDAETQARIFEPFFTTKEKGKGTGLGLATVYGIIKQSGGYIWVHSEAGQGTTFEIYLPRVEEAVAADQEEHAVSQPPAGSETVLLVEDEAPVRKLAREFLESNGYTVLEAKDGVEAIQSAQQHSGPIHLMVTDVVMPKMSGHELAQQMASVRPEMKVLYISGYTGDALGQYGVPTQDSFFLQKPFSLDTLARKMRQFLKTGKGV